MPDQIFKYDVFLSHSSKDKPVIRDLAEQLKNDGIKVWFDEWIIKPGDSIPIKIEDGLQHTQILILCMSPNAFDSDWVALERHTMIFRDPTNKERRFIPLLIEDCEIPLLLKQYLYLDWRDKSEDVYNKLLGAVQRNTYTIKQDLSKSYLIKTLKGHENEICSLAISSDGKKIVSGDALGIIKIWDFISGENITTIDGHDSKIEGIVITPDGEYIISCSNDDTIKIWDVKSEKNITTLEGHTANICEVAITPDEKNIFSCSYDGTIKIWDLNGNNIDTIEGHISVLYGIAITPDGKNIISCSSDKTLKIWDLESKENIDTLYGHTSAVLGVAITPNGKNIVSCSSDNTLKIWDIKSGKNTAILEGHTDPVFGVAITPDGKNIISCSADLTLKIWDIKSGKNVFTLAGHAGYIKAIAITPDGKNIVSCSADETLKIWDLENIQPIKSSENIKYTNAKVALIGESGVGKTGLAIRLAEDDWRPTESTHGMNILPLELPNVGKKEIDKEVWLWDFAGQPDYRLVHQLYMEQISLALLVIDPQKEDPLKPLSHWENALSKAVNFQPNKLLVSGRCDRGGITISKEKLQNYCEDNHYKSFHLTKAKTGEGCDVLKEAIANAIPWDDLPWRTSSISFKKLKDTILEIIKEGKVILPFDSLKQQLQLNLSDAATKTAEIRAVVGLLSGQGVIKALDFGDLVLLQPEQINNYASAIIRTIGNNTEETGHIKKDDVLEAKIDFGDLERVDEQAEKEILRSIVQTFIDRNICLQEDTQYGTQLVFPSYFKIERPELIEAPNVFVAYSFIGIIEEIYATLIVRLIHTNDFDKDVFWKYAADFKTHSGKRLGLQMVKNTERAELKVYFESNIPDDTKVSFIKYIHEHLKTHAKEVNRVRSYVCLKCSETVEQSRVMKRMQKGMKNIICDDCDSPIPFEDMIEQKFGSDKFDEKVIEMDKEAQFNIDNESKELILVGHSYSTVANAGHIFRTTSNSDWGIDGEIEFKNKDGNASGKKVYVQLKSGGSHLKIRKRDKKEIFYIKSDRLVEYWQSHNYPVMLVIRNEEGKIRWMNITANLMRQAQKTKSIEFVGENFTPLNVDNLRKQLYPKI